MSNPSRFPGGLSRVDGKICTCAFHDWWPNMGSEDRAERMSEIYIRDIQKLIGLIGGMETGRAVLNEIDRVGKWIYIYPRILGVTHDFYNRKKGKLKPTPVFQAGVRARDKLSATWGGGSEVEIYFSPQLPWVEWHIETCGPDVVLFHELVHSLRAAAGRIGDDGSDPLDVLSPGKPALGVSTPWEFKNIEEFIAVLLTNIYRSEKGGPLRATYRGPRRHKTLSTAEQKAFAGKYGPQIDAVLKGHPQLALELSRVHAGFNPIRDHKAVLRPQTISG